MTTDSGAGLDPHAAGLSDGYRVGPAGLDPDGHPTTGYDPTLIGDPDYRAGLSEGRSRRIDEQLRTWAEDHPMRDWAR